MNVKRCPFSAGKSDTEWMKELAEGNPEALGAIYHRYAATLRPVILGVLHEQADADEVLHDVFLQLWNQVDRYLPDKGLQGFLRTLARRRALDRVRRELAYRRATGRFETHVSAEFCHRLRAASRPLAPLDLTDLMNTLIRQLPEAQQEVVHLTFYEGLSQREIASRKSIALGTVKTRLDLAKKKLLRQLTAVHECL